MFFGLRFSIVVGSLFGGSNFEKSIKTIDFSMVFVNFHKIDVFDSTKNV